MKINEKYFKIINACLTKLNDEIPIKQNTNLSNFGHNQMTLTDAEIGKTVLIRLQITSYYYPEVDRVVIHFRQTGTRLASDISFSDEFKNHHEDFEEWLHYLVKDTINQFVHCNFAQ